MTQLGIGLALVLVIEGGLYALFPAAMKRTLAFALTQPAGVLRWGGLAAAAIGVALVWVIRQG